MNDKTRLISNRGAQDLSRPAVFIKDAKASQAKDEQNHRMVKKQARQNKASK